MALSLPDDITANGVSQGSLFNLLSNIVDLVNELQSDHATYKTLTDELKTDGSAVFADLTAIRAAFVALTAKMDADFADVTNASTDYAASVDPAALTATAIAASGPAALTNSTALTLNAG